MPGGLFFLEISGEMPYYDCNRKELFVYAVFECPKSKQKEVS